LTIVRQKFTEQDEEDLLYSQESFTTKVNKFTSGTKTRAELIEVKLENGKNKSKAGMDEPKRCPRLKDQEDADRTELSMKRDAKNNEIPCTTVTPTILSSSDALLVEMNKKLGVISSNDNDVHSIVSIIKSLEQTRKVLFEESKKNKEIHQPNATNLFTQVTAMVDDMAEDNDDELVVYTSTSRGHLSKPANKIVKL
jgi:hypothetical protein